MKRPKVAAQRECVPEQWRYNHGTEEVIEQPLGTVVEF